MRLVELVTEWREHWKRNLYRSFLRYRNRAREEHLRAGHLYRDGLTGEYFTIGSVGPQVAVTRHDAELREHHSVGKDQLQLALDVGIIEHDRRRCGKCPNVRMETQ